VDILIIVIIIIIRIPDAPEAPIFLSKTDTTVMIKWSSPPAFNLEISAYHLQYRIGLRGLWLPSPLTPPITIPPWSRSIIVPDLEPSQAYQFRLRAENEMGSSKWGGLSKLIMTDLGVPKALERPTACQASMISITVFWFVPNPTVFTGASSLFNLSYSGDTKSYEQHPVYAIPLEECLAEGSILLKRFSAILMDYNVSMIERKRRKAEFLTINANQSGSQDESVRTGEDQNGHDIDNCDSEVDDDIFPVPGNELVIVEDQGEDHGEDKREESECKLHPLAIERVMSRLADEIYLFVAYTTSNLAIGCPYRCICICIYVYKYVYKYVYIYIHSYVYVYVHIYICIHICTYMCMYIQYIVIYTCVYVLIGFKYGPRTA
jgi:hypothetical protein